MNRVYTSSTVGKLWGWEFSLSNVTARPHPRPLPRGEGVKAIFAAGPL
jgi:hypothetical protein